MELYLKIDVGNVHNTTKKKLQRFKEFITHCINMGYIKQNPFGGVRMNLKKTIRHYLTAEELQGMMNKQLGERLAIVRDMFVFCCFTGLSYSDAKGLTGSLIEKMPDGSFCVYKNRQKSIERSSIPLLPIPMKILGKYNDLETVDKKKKLLPMRSLNVMNGYLKEIANICGINKNITFHMSRHRILSFAL